MPAYNLHVRRLEVLARLWLALLLSSHFAVFAVSPANTKTARAWRREVQGGKEFSDLSSLHPLQYFTDDPFLRDDENDFCTDCAPTGKSQVHKQHRFKTELSKIGDIHRLALYDLYYYFDEGIESRTIGWKSILVRGRSGQFREIYHLQSIGTEISPSYFQDAGSVEILATNDSIPGTGNFSYESYWWFDKDGPVKINTEQAVSTALEDVLPAGFLIETAGGLDLESLTFMSSVWKRGDAHCCPTGGGVKVKFRLDKGLLVAIENVFTPD